MDKQQQGGAISNITNNQLYHSGVLSILPNIKQVADGDILYKLRDEEIVGIKSRIDYLDRSASDTKYQLFIDSPLKETLNKLASKEPASYRHYDNIIALQKEQFRKQLGDEYYDKIDIHDSTDVLKQDDRYNSLCKALNEEYLNLKPGSGNDEQGEETWFVFKRNTCDAIRLMTYENAKHIINNETENIYFLHGDFDGIVDVISNNFENAVEGYLEIDDLLSNDFKELFGTNKNKYQEHLLSFFKKNNIDIFVSDDNGLFIIKSCDNDIIQRNFDFKEEFLYDDVGDTIWQLMDEKTNQIFFDDDEYQSNITDRQNKLITNFLNNLSNTSAEQRDIKTWGIESENEDIRTYLKIILDKPLPDINVPLSSTGELVRQTKDLLNNDENLSSHSLNDVEASQCHNPNKKQRL